jgi:phage gp16-like protein
MTRATDLAKIHIGKKQMGWDETLYRDTMQQITGKRSSAVLDFGDRFKMLEYFKTNGVKFTSKNSVSQASKANKPRIKKIYALWFLLYNADQVRSKTPQAIDTWSSKITGKKRLVWADGHNLNQCIESLKSWCNRCKLKVE